MATERGTGAPRPRRRIFSRSGAGRRAGLDAEWAGRRWFEMRVGYGTYMAFMFGFANFILLLHGLTDWFKDYPLHWFVLATVAVIIPVSILVGHRHNRTQQKTETRRLTHLNPYINLLTPRSKEVFLETQLHAMIDLMISTTRSPDLRSELAKLRDALDRYMGGETASGSLDKEGVRHPFPGPSGFAVAPPPPHPLRAGEPGAIAPHPPHPLRAGEPGAIAPHPPTPCARGSRGRSRRTPPTPCARGSRGRSWYAPAAPAP